MTEVAKKWINTVAWCVCVCECCRESINIGHGKTRRKCLAANATVQPLFSKENFSTNTHAPCAFALKVRRARDQVEIETPQWRRSTKCQISHITRVYWRSIFMYFLSVSTFSSVRAQNVILPHGGPESGETSTGRCMRSTHSELKPHGGFSPNDIWMTCIKGIQRPI